MSHAVAVGLDLTQETKRLETLLDLDSGFPREARGSHPYRRCHSTHACRDRGVISHDIDHSKVVTNPDLLVVLSCAGVTFRKPVAIWALGSPESSPVMKSGMTT